MNILDAYVRATPHPQLAIDLFKGEWSSMLPPETGLNAGQADLFQDQRIIWTEQQLGGFEGKSVIELGPLEAGHTYLMEKRGAESIIAIEANTRAYLKCLIVKEILELKCARFLLGDFLEYLRQTREHFGFCLASGVLYHMLNPTELIQLIAKVSDAVLLWTHYYDETVIRAAPNLAIKFPEMIHSEHGGFKHKLYKYSYLDALNWNGFCGGSASYSFWMSRDEILSCLEHFGFRKLRIGFDTLEHPNGPSFCVFASK
jgi:hypothetical protein